MSQLISNIKHIYNKRILKNDIFQTDSSSIQLQVKKKILGTITVV